VPSRVSHLLSSALEPFSSECVHRDTIYNKLTDVSEKGVSPRQQNVCCIDSSCFRARLRYKYFMSFGYSVLWTPSDIGKTFMPPRRRTLSCYRPHLETSLALIEQAMDARTAAIIDIGGGQSTLVDGLLLRGYQNITVLDVSQTAIDVTKERLGSAAEQVRWRVGDITEIELEQGAYYVWHDRAVFHFLTAPEQRIAYIRQVQRQAGGTCHREHVWSGRSHKMQRTRGDAV